MTDMDTRQNRVFGTGFMLAMILATFAAFAQGEIKADTIEPAVGTAANIADEDIADERESLQPAVASPVLAQDVTRHESGSEVMDSIELGRSEITGNQELPKVMYIVPWQKSDPGDLMGRPVNTLLDEVLAPLDREEFIRKVNYHSDLYGDEEE